MSRLFTRTTDAELLREADQDPAAFGVFYRRHERAVLAFAGHLSGSAQLGADVMAETFAVAFEARDRFDPQRGAGRAWLFGIARNVLGASRRRGRVEADARQRLGMNQLILSQRQLSAFDRVIAADGEAAVREWLSSIPAPQRDAVRLRVVEEQSYASIAQQLQCSETVVRQRVSRGLATLRDVVGGQR
jgi:RNA polymerase sigma factor (sigma-70 family)